MDSKQGLREELWEKEPKINRTLSHQHTHINEESCNQDHSHKSNATNRSVMSHHGCNKRNIQSPFLVTIAASKSEHLCWSDATETKWLCGHSLTHISINFIPAPPFVELLKKPFDVWQLQAFCIHEGWSDSCHMWSSSWHVLQTGYGVRNQQEDNGWWAVGTSCHPPIWVGYQWWLISIWTKTWKLGVILQLHGCKIARSLYPFWSWVSDWLWLNTISLWD